MVVEFMVKRTIWVAKCPQCEDMIEKDKNPPRERHCNKCDIWVPYKEFSSISPEYKALQK